MEDAAEIIHIRNADEEFDNETYRIALNRYFCLEERYEHLRTQHIKVLTHFDGVCDCAQ